jgi:CRISPR-associated protein Csd2
VLRLLHEEAYTKAGIKDATKEKKGKDKAGDMEKARKWMCGNFFDVRTFGAVMSLKEFNCGQVRGPAQITFARSIDPIIPMEVSITRKSVATLAEAESQMEKHGTITGTMGRKHAVPYAMYRGQGFINAHLARDTGFTFGDLSLFFRAVQMMFDLDRSASRGLMSVRGLHVFQHASALGEAPAHLLFDRVLTPKLGSEQAPRSFADYKQGIQVAGDLPEGVGYRDLTAEPITDSYFPW